MPNDLLTHAGEIANGGRFEFGKNWQQFLKTLTPERIAAAERSLCEMLREPDLAGSTMLDIGSGSGLSSLAARRLGARVHSFDYDPASVAATRSLRERFFPGDSLWTVEEGSALDANYLRSLGKFDLVYSWGVLHHTGAMWRALENSTIPVASQGRLFIAIYNTQPYCTPLHKLLKRSYVGASKPGKWLIAAGYLGVQIAKGLVKDLVLARDPRARYRDDPNRGMSRWHDMLDWVGGYPFETATVNEVFDYFRARGYSLEMLRAEAGYGCNQFVFERRARPQQGTELQSSLEMRAVVEAA